MSQLDRPNIQNARDYGIQYNGNIKVDDKINLKTANQSIIKLGASKEQKQDSKKDGVQVIKYKYYYRQQFNELGKSFDLRFQSIKNSTINKGALVQIGHAASFQIKKSWKSLKLPWSQSQPYLKRQKQINFYSGQNQIKMTWLGHASVLISICGDTHILIDPMFEKRVIQYIGQKRLIDPPCTIKQLPKIDFVLISHDHYDHCNTKSLQEIYKHNQKRVTYIVGKNSKDILPGNCIYKQLSWTQSKQYQVNGKKIVKITFVPACHWSKRSLTDQNHRLWGGFVIETCGKKIYFAGDTGYCGLFEQLYQQFQGFDLSLIPIGAYEPNEFLCAQHINPKQAVQVHNQVKSKLSVGIHWGTFPMSHQTPQQVVSDFQEARKNIQYGEFKTINIGGSVTLNCGQEQNVGKCGVYNKQSDEVIQ